MFKLFLGGLLFLFTASLPLGALTVEEILANFNETIKTPTIQGIFHAKLIAQNGDVREIKARAYQKLVGPYQNNRLFIFDFPPAIRGTGLLLHSYFDQRPNNMWIYLPAIRRVKRIALEDSGGGYFMGSDFTYSDLINNDNSKMEFEKLPDAAVGENECYSIKAWGSSPKVQKERGYSFIISYYRKDNFLLVKREFFDFNEDLLKVYEVNDFLEFGPYLYPVKMTMKNVQNNHQSILEVSEATTEDIPDKYFTTRYLQNN